MIKPNSNHFNLQTISMIIHSYKGKCNFDNNNIKKFKTLKQIQQYKMQLFGRMIQNHQNHQNHPQKKYKYLDPDWEQAKNHGMASRVGFSTLQGIQDRCWCCFEQIHKKPVSLSQNTKQLQFLGFGFPLYFAFVRNCIFLLILTICSYNIIALYQAFTTNQNFCKEYRTVNLSDINDIAIHSLSINYNIPSTAHFKNYQSHRYTNMRFFNQINSPNYQNHYEEEEKQKQEDNKDVQCTSLAIFASRMEKKVHLNQKILRGSAFIIHLIFLIYMRDKLVKMRDYFDQRTASPSDYAVLMQNIPNTNDLRNKIGFHITRDFKVNQLVDIILIPSIDNYQKLQKQKQKLLVKLKAKVKKQQFNAQTEDLQRQIQAIDVQVRNYIVQEKNNYVNNRMNAEKAIVIFNTQHDKHQVLDNFQETGFSHEEWKEVTIKQAPQPRQIIWKNIFLDRKIHIYLTILGWVLSVLLLVALTVGFTFLSKAKSQIVQKQMENYRQNKPGSQNQHIKALLLVFGMIFLVVLLNKMVISTLFHKFTDMQRHSSTHKYQFSFCLKYCLGLFFTTALMTLIVEDFLMGNIFQHDFGVIEEETVMFLVNSLFVPLFWLINPMYIYRRFVQNSDEKKRYFTQQQANKTMELPEYDVGKRYGEVLQIMWFTFLYLSLIPVGGIFSCIGLFIYYWIDKYNLLRRSSINSKVSGNLIFLTLSMLDFTLILRIAGEMLFDYQMRDGIHTSTIVFFVISIIYQIIPIETVINFFNKERFHLQDMTYNQAHFNFKQSYYDEHLLFSRLKEDRQVLAQQLVQKLCRNANLGINPSAKF